MEALVQIPCKTGGRGQRNAEAFRGITVEELNEKWNAAVLELRKKEIMITNPDHALEGALSIRYGAVPTMIKTRPMMTL